MWASLANGNTSTLFFDAKGVVFENDGTSYKSNPAYFWPGAGTLNFTAVANAPESGFVPNLNTVRTALESFTYTVPADATAQEDIVVATASVGGANNATVPLNFKHIMSAVNFKVGSIVKGEIRSIKVKNVYNKASYLVDQGVWALNSTGDFSVTMNGDPYVVPNESDDKTINPKGAVLMMIPQVLPEDAVIEVEFYDSESKNTTKYTASIKDDVWDMGKTTNYVISIGESFNIEIEPIGKLLDAHYIIKEIKVTVNDTQEDQNGKPRIISASIEGATANDEIVTLMPEKLDNITTSLPKHATELNMIQNGFWCDKYVTKGEDGNYTPDASTTARGYKEIEGTGNIDGKKFYVMIPENNSTSDRNIKITLYKKQNPNVSRTLYMTQRCPRWTGNTPGSYGWETVDDNEDGQYGFTFTRIAYYVFTYSFTQVGWGSNTYYHAGFGTIDEGIESVKTNYVDIYVPKIDNFISFTTIDWGSKLGLKQKRYYLTINYSVLNNLSIKETSNGLKNTVDLYNQGGSATTTFEQIIANAPKTYRDETGPTFRQRNSDDPAAFPASTGSINDLSGILSYVLKKNRYYLHSYNNGTADINAPILLSTDDIKWYIPAYGQFSTFVPDPNIKDKDGNPDSADDYWSSTAAENATNPADAKSYHGGGSAISRSTELGVIAVRVFDDDTKTATATIDEINVEEMKGGENGEAQWVE